MSNAACMRSLVASSDTTGDNFVEDNATVLGGVDFEDLEEVVDCAEASLGLGFPFAWWFADC